jgi:hypothetical protein
MAGVGELFQVARDLAGRNVPDPVVLTSAHQGVLLLKKVFEVLL